MTIRAEKFDVILDENEVILAQIQIMNLLKGFARKHYIDNEGWTEEEVDKYLTCEEPEFNFLRIEVEEGIKDFIFTEIAIPVIVNMAKYDPKNAQEDWSGWIAVLFHHDNESCNWCISPKKFWEEHHYIPDHCLDRVPEGFFECREHTLDSSYSIPEQEHMLRNHGFEIVKWEN